MLVSTKYPNQQLVVSGTHDVGAQDTILLCDTSSAPVVINLATIPANYWSTQYKLYVVDYSGNATVNNITINAPATYTINTMSSYVINANGVALEIIIGADTKYIANYATVPGHIIADEGVNLTQQPILDFQGAGVTATNGAGKTIVTIPGGGTAGHVISNQGSNLPQQPILNFTGTGVVASNGSGETTVTINGLSVANTVYVMKNGNDSTGLVERFDYPFLTISAAVAAALIAFPSRTVTSRIKIVVESGNYNESINLYSFIDFDLGNSVITAPASQACVRDTLGTFTQPTNGNYNNIIYGNASFICTNTQDGTERPETFWFINGGKYLIYGTSAYARYGEAVYIQSGSNATFKGVNFKTDNFSANAFVQVVQMTSLTADTTGNVLAFFDCYFSNDSALPTQKAVIISSIQVGATVTNKLLLNNCQIANYSTTQSAIQAGEGTATGKLDLTLINTAIWNNTYTYSLSKYMAGSTFNVRVYNSYSNKPVDVSTLTPTQLIGNLLVDPNVEFNQGNIL